MKPLNLPGYEPRFLSEIGVMLACLFLVAAMAGTAAIRTAYPCGVWGDLVLAAVVEGPDGPQNVCVSAKMLGGEDGR